MTLHAATPAVVRFPPRLRAVQAASPLDVLFSAGTIASTDIVCMVSRTRSRRSS